MKTLLLLLGLVPFCLAGMLPATAATGQRAKDEAVQVVDVNPNPPASLLLAGCLAHRATCLAHSTSSMPGTNVRTTSALLPVTGNPAVLPTAPSAHALRTYKLKGKPPGLARVYDAQGWGMWSGNLLRFGGGEFGVAPRYARQLQTVCATKRVFKFIGQYYERPWHLDFATRQCIKLRPGNHPQFADYDYPASVAAAYHIDLVVSWYLQRGGLVAKARYDFDDIADYTCMNASCYTLYGYHDVAAISLSAGYTR